MSGGISPVVSWGTGERIVLCVAAWLLANASIRTGEVECLNAVRLSSIVSSLLFKAAMLVAIACAQAGVPPGILTAKRGK